MPSILSITICILKSLLKKKKNCSKTRFWVTTHQLRIAGLNSEQWGEMYWTDSAHSLILCLSNCCHSDTVDLWWIHRIILIFFFIILIYRKNICVTFHPGAVLVIGYSAQQCDNSSVRMVKTILSLCVEKLTIYVLWIRLNDYNYKTYSLHGKYF